MEKLQTSPNDIRLAQFRIRKGIKDETLPPSSFIKILNLDEPREMQEARKQEFERSASPDLKNRVKIVSIALKILEVFDKPI